MNGDAGDAMEEYDAPAGVGAEEEEEEDDEEEEDEMTKEERRELREKERGTTSLASKYNTIENAGVRTTQHSEVYMLLSFSLSLFLSLYSFTHTIKDYTHTHTHTHTYSFAPAVNARVHSTHTRKLLHS